MSQAAISRRSFLETTDGLIVGFTLLDPAWRVLAQGGTPLSNAGGLPPDQLDSSLAIAPDGTVSVFTSKVDLGTGTGTAFGQIVAEELDVPMSKIDMVIGDTTRSVDQGRTSASRTLERAGPQMRQAASAARQELLKRASQHLGTPATQLTVVDGIVSVAGNPARTVSYAALVGGKPFDTQIAASGEQWDLKLAPEITPKSPQGLQDRGNVSPAHRLAAEVHR
jgi:CO/xanthine dehydrogenase Mo-binding subunit